MQFLKKILSPLSTPGSFTFSLLIHAVLIGGLIVILGIHFTKNEEKKDYLDLGYQTFDEPPVPEKVEHRVARSAEPTAPVDTKIKPDNTPKELQDEKGDVSGTQKAQKEANVGNTSNGDANATPYYHIKPKYPRAALLAGTEGWVLCQFDINEQGEVENVRVVDGVERNMFEAEAKRAVSKYKYKPYMDASGHPIRKIDHQVRVDFKLQDAETSGS